MLSMNRHSRKVSMDDYDGFTQFFRQNEREIKRRIFLEKYPRDVDDKRIYNSCWLTVDAVEAVLCNGVRTTWVEISSLEELLEQMVEGRLLSILRDADDKDHWVSVVVGRDKSWIIESNANDSGGLLTSFCGTNTEVCSMFEFSVHTYSVTVHTSRHPANKERIEEYLSK